MALLQMYNSVLEDGEVPDCWRTTCFHMLPKNLRAMHASDFRPIAKLRLLYKVFAYLILGRIEHTPDTYQPEEQHGFRSKYRLEEHLLTANLFLDKATAHGIPVSNVGKFGSFRSFRPCALAYSLECTTCSGHFGSHDMDAVETV